jgi:putative ABC transport system permease protein
MDHPTEARFNSVSPEYFETLQINLVRGRFFTAQDVNANVPVVVISADTAQRYWPGDDPIGKQLAIPEFGQVERNDVETPTLKYKQYEVVGVVRDARSRWIWQKDEAFIYLPLVPGGPLGRYLMVRTETDPASVMNTVRAQAAAIDPALRVSVRRIDDSLAFQLAPFRAIAWLSGVLGMLALVLASIGLYGVMAFLVTQRTREIGIRIALGAQPTDVVRMFVVQGLKLTAVGIICGVAGGALISRLLAAVLIDISPLDPIAFGGVAGFLTMVALLAVFVPARRATKVDPMVALRYE